MSILSQQLRLYVPTLTLVMSVVAPTIAGAQSTGSMRGTVLDSANRAPVAAARVVVVGTRLGAETDADGKYVVRGIPAGPQTIRVSRIGYSQRTKPVTVSASGEVVVDFALERAAVQLDQIVTTATGAQRSVELGHAVSALAADSLAKVTPVRSIADVLNTRVPGAIINGQNGYTGTVAPIRFRGINSLTVSNNPIIIVDGARIEATPSTSATLSSRLGDLSLPEIETLEVVKGPAAATLYGTDAANGVIVIRTKRGSVGPTRWELFGETGRIVERMGDYQNYHGWGHSASGAVVQCLLINIAAGTCVQDSITKYSPIDDPENTFIAPGYRGNYGLQASGGAGRFRYMASGALEHELGWLMMPRSEQARISLERGGAAIPDEQQRPNWLRKSNFRVNLSTDLGSKADLTFANGMIAESFRGGNSGVVSYAYWGPGYNDKTLHGYYTGPVGDYFAVRAAEGITRYISSLSGNYRPINWLATRGTVGFDYSNNIGDNLQKNGEGPAGVNRTGRRNQLDNVISQYSADVGATATPSRTLPWSLTSRTSIGGQYNRRTNVQTSITGVGLPPGSTTISGAATVTASETHADAIVVGAYLDQQVGWRDRLFVTLGFRQDGASTFGSNLHTTTYPKVSASWLASSGGSSKLPGVTSLRFRAAYGQSGVQPPSTARLTTVALGNAAINNQTVSAVTPGAWGNPNVKPERQEELEGGFDLDAFTGRVQLELTGYSRKSTDALLLAPFASSVGASGSAYSNIGSVTNKGLEGLLTLRAVDRAAVGLDLTLNGSINNNRLVSAGANAAPGFFQNFGFAALRHRVGYPLYSAWQKPIVSFADKNGDGILAPSELVVGDTEVYVGPGQPREQLAATTNLSLWRDAVRFTVLFDWRGGYKRYDYTASGCFLFFQCLGAIDKRSPLEEQAKQIAFLSYASAIGWFTPGDFTRLREASVRFRLPSRALGVSGARDGALVLSGQNLLFWSKYSGGDPEVNGSTGSDLNYTFPTAPAARYFIVRVNLSY